MCTGKLAAWRYETYTLRTRRIRIQGATAAAPFHKSPEPHHEHQHGYSTASPCTRKSHPCTARPPRFAGYHSQHSSLHPNTPHHTYTRYPHWIPTPDPNTTPSHHNSVLSHFPILVFPLFRHHELHFWGFSSATTQRRGGAPLVAARAMVFGWDEWAMTRTRWLMLLLAPEMGGLMFRDMPSSGSALRFLIDFVALYWFCSILLISNASAMSHDRVV